jgi:hypothetical protein
MSYYEQSDIYSAQNFFTGGNGIVTLCGSTKYFAECLEINRRLTFDGWIVLMCGSWGHSYHKDVENINTDYSKVKKLHFIKILKSSAIVVVSDKTGYFGDSTKAEIAFAEYHKIPVFYFDGEYLTGSTTVKPSNKLELCEDVINQYQNNGNSLGF